MKITFNEQEYEYPDKLSEFSFQKMTSSNIDVWGVNKKRNEILVQFNGGKVFVYQDVTADILEKAEAPTTFKMPDGSPMTIGKLVSNYIVKKFPSINISITAMIVPIYDGEVLTKEDIFDGKGKIVCLKHVVVTIVNENGNVFIVQDNKGNKFAVPSDKLLVKSPSKTED